MKYHLISCIDDALNIAAKALHDREDWNDRPRILEAMAVSLRGRNTEERVLGLLYIAQAHGNLNTSYVPLLPYSKTVREALFILKRHDSRDCQDPIRRQIQRIKDSSLSASSLSREAAALATTILCNAISVREKQLERDLSDLRNGSQDVGVTLSISFFTHDLEDVQRDKEALMDAFGEERFQN